MSSLVEDRNRRLATLADGYFERYAQKVRADLRADKTKLSADESGLENVWEEFVDQLFGEHSIFFELHEDLVTSFCDAVAASLPPGERDWLSFFTEGYLDWWTETQDGMAMPAAGDKASWIAGRIYSDLIKLADRDNDARDDEDGDGAYDDDE